VSTDKITLEIFSEKLGLLMADHDVTQEDLANAVGVAQSAISNYTRGIRLPPIEEAGKIAKFFGVTLDSMLGWDSAKEQASAISYVAGILAERFGETPEDQQRFFGEYLVLIEKTFGLGRDLAQALEELRAKTVFLSHKSSSRGKEAAHRAAQVLADKTHKPVASAPPKK
jgi:transcriptional regulator with XRE-family HTH domain